jgi:hypothetical protein
MADLTAIVVRRDRQTHPLTDKAAGMGRGLQPGSFPDAVANELQ